MLLKNFVRKSILSLRASGINGDRMDLIKMVGCAWKNIIQMHWKKRIVEWKEHCEYVSDAYYEIIKAEQEGLITICRYDEFIKKRKEWLQKTIRDEFANSLLAPDYRFFLENKFADILAGK